MEPLNNPNPNVNNPNPNVNNPSLNVNRIGALDQLTNDSMHLIMRYFAPPSMREDISTIPTALEVGEAFVQIQSANPELVRVMLEQYSMNPRDYDRLAELQEQLVQQQRQERQQYRQQQQQVPLNTPLPEGWNPSLFNLEAYLYGTFHIGHAKLSLGPLCKCKVPSGEPSVGLKVGLSIDPSNGGKTIGVGGSCSLSKKHFKATGGAETDLSRSSVERSVTVKTNVPNDLNVGVQLKDNNLTGMSLFAPSNVVKNGEFVFSHHTKGDGIETTASVLPFQTIKDRVGRHKKQTENQPKFAETRMKRREVQRVCTQQMPGPDYTLTKGTIVKVSLLTVLICLLWYFVVKIRSFLKNERARRGF